MDPMSPSERRLSGKKTGIDARPAPCSMLSTSARVCISLSACATLFSFSASLKHSAAGLRSSVHPDGARGVCKSQYPYRHEAPCVGDARTWELDEDGARCEDKEGGSDKTRSTPAG